MRGGPRPAPSNSLQTSDPGDDGDESDTSIEGAGFPEHGESGGHAGTEPVHGAGVAGHTGLASLQLVDGTLISDRLDIVADAGHILEELEKEETPRLMMKTQK